MHIIARKENVKFKCSPLGLIFRCLPGEVMYILTVSENGIVRFHLSPERWTLSRFLFLLADSEPGCCTWYKNLKHARKEGCFCLGVFYKSTSGPLLMRFNRWAGELAPFWAAAREPQK